MVCDDLRPKITGHCVITDPDTNEVLVDKTNQINFENFSYALALSLAARPNGSIQIMQFGNGASSVSAIGVITYLPPNVTGMAAQLYNQTYQKFVNDQSPLDTNTTDNYLTVNHIANTTFSDVVVTCLLNYNEPAGQEAFDTNTQAAILDVTGSSNGTYIFDEIGLATWNASINSGMLLSHVIFSPVQKALNRRIQIIYTLRLAMS
jgi:hypothetical protein